MNGLVTALQDILSPLSSSREQALGPANEQQEFASFRPPPMPIWLSGRRMEKKPFEAPVFPVFALFSELGEKTGIGKQVC